MDNYDNDKSTKVIITPETKISALLESHPELEPVLIEMTPAFGKLRNPVLRKTIARVTSLKQAAEIAKISLPELINRLRIEVKQSQWSEGSNGAEMITEYPRVEIEYQKVTLSIDARRMLERGEHPVDQVMTELANMEPQQILELVTDFDPLPLKELAGRKGIKTWTHQETDYLFKTYFVKNK